MRYWKLSTIGNLANRTNYHLLLVGTLTVLLTLASGRALAANGAPMTPEVAAKHETVRKQQEQRITPQKRKAAADALKAERLRVYKARQAAQQLTPVTTDK